VTNLPQATGTYAAELDRWASARQPGAGCPQDVPPGWDAAATGDAHLDVPEGQLAPTLTVHPRGRRAPRPATPAITPAGRAQVQALALTVGCPVPACRAAIGHGCRNAGPHKTRIILAGRTTPTAVPS
jgi:hypothetical protein